MVLIISICLKRRLFTDPVRKLSISKHQNAKDLRYALDFAFSDLILNILTIFVNPKKTLGALRRCGVLFKRKRT
ncbi:unnamed protein product [Caenorhabditis sp. 36 PRJEB53466]|nr:unnamed protein product [Caenorhabditis sp. 36 PRJEB53466]CAI2355774.1 unnamed protein product [Caenorhabditis sp. 36 PRJEB53466]